MKAYILINVELRQIEAVAHALRQTVGITQVEVVTGPYDMIAFLESTDINGITDFLTNQIQNIPGIAKTLTGFVLPM